MRSVVRTLAAVLAGLALVAALPAPCDCLPERVAPGDHGHECCTPPVGVSAADRGCCDEAPAIAEAVPSPVAPTDAVPLALATLPVITRPALRTFGRFVVPLAPSPPPTVLRI